MYVAQTTLVPIQTQQYALVPQNLQFQATHVTIPVTIPLAPPKVPTIPSIPYEKFIPPTPASRKPEDPKVYQYYKYVPVTQQQTIPQVVSVIPQYQTVTVPTISTY